MIIGVIPAGGKATRLAPYNIPKEMIPVGYQDIERNLAPKPISQYLVERMKKEESLRNIFFVLSQGKSAIMDYYKSGKDFGIDIAYTYQDTPDGTASSIDTIYPFLNDDEETILYGMPDTLFFPENAYQILMKKHRETSNDVSLGLFRVDNPHNYGIITLETGTHKVIKHYDKPIEKDNDNLAWGIAIWNERFVSLIHTLTKENKNKRFPSDIGDVLDMAIETGLNIRGYEFHEGVYFDTGTPQGLYHATHYMEKR